MSASAQAEGLRVWMPRQLAAVEDALAQHLAAPSASPALAEAMRYAVLGGGKRLRALLVLAACHSVQGSGQAALRAACAIELIHAYSLVHDDMPCMDNDVLRRGKPTVHVRFGQAQALLAGDALQALAFELLTPDAATHDMPAALQARLCALLARAAGAQGMAGGQAIDLASVGLSLSAEALAHMHRLKTGALLQCSVMMGAACGTCSVAAREALADYAACIGLAFQVVDDVLDVTASAATLGKTAGKDAAAHKPTYVSLLGLAAAQQHAQQLHAQALDALEAAALPDDALLRALAAQLVQRAC